MTVLEKDIESAFQRKAKSLGWLTHKLDSGRVSRGWPDRMVLLPNGNIVFIELKTPKGKVSQLQEFRHGQLRDFLQTVYVCRSAKEAIDTCLRHC